jgi:hypothetical protein
MAHSRKDSRQFRASPDRRRWGPEVCPVPSSATLLCPPGSAGLESGALAAGILAFSRIAPFMPGSAADYPYYAPAGRPGGHVRESSPAPCAQGLQTLVGSRSASGWPSCCSCLGQSDAADGSRGYGPCGVRPGRTPEAWRRPDWIPTAALPGATGRAPQPDTVLLRATCFKMAAGVTVGILVNLLVFPPLHFPAAEPQHRRSSAQALAQQALGHGQGPQGELAAGARRAGPAVRRRSQRARALSASPSRRPTRAARPIPRPPPPSARRRARLPQPCATSERIPSTSRTSDPRCSLMSSGPRTPPLWCPMNYAAPLADAMASVGDVLPALETETTGAGQLELAKSPAPQVSGPDCSACRRSTRQTTPPSAVRIHSRSASTACCGWRTPRRTEAIPAGRTAS